MKSAPKRATVAAASQIAALGPSVSPPMRISTTKPPTATVSEPWTGRSIATASQPTTQRIQAASTHPTAPDEHPKEAHEHERARQGPEVLARHRFGAERETRGKEDDRDEEQIDDPREQSGREAVGRVGRLRLAEQRPRARAQT